MSHPAAPHPFRIFALVASLALSAGCDEASRQDDPHTIISETDNGKVIELATGRLLKLRLPTRPSTGFVWEVTQMDGSLLEELDGETEPPLDAVVGEATHVRRFIPAGTGRARLELVYRRPWEKSASPLRRFSVEVVVAGPFDGAAPAPMTAVAEPAEILVKAEAATSLPSKFNYCDIIGGCTPIKDQGQCGGCWAFATNGVTEQLIRGRDGTTPNLSEQYLISCNTSGFSCSAGGYVAFDHYVNKYASGEPGAGAVYTADFPYQASDVACNSPHQHHEKLASYATTGTTVDEIKNSILNNGPLWTVVCSSGYGFYYYTGGILGSTDCTYPDHAVVIVGWDDDGGNGHWIVRNSWGAGWGEKGYMRIKYGVNALAARDNYYAKYTGTGSSTCVKTTCEAQGKSCGTIADGCGGALQCGRCTGNDGCVDNVCTACVPRSCMNQGKNCGTVPDGCGGTLECGTCTSPTTCGGSGTSNVCGTTCATPFASQSCRSYTTGTVVSANGHNWSCTSPACTVCRWFASCNPGATGCPWGAVWTDLGRCQ